MDGPIGNQKGEKEYMKKLIKQFVGACAIASLSLTPMLASSHGEAPLISMDRFADNTDTYAFRSVEAGRENFVTLIANYIPLQNRGGPQWFRFADACCMNEIDNTGDGSRY